MKDLFEALSLSFLVLAGIREEEKHQGHNANKYRGAELAGLYACYRKFVRVHHN